MRRAGRDICMHLHGCRRLHFDARPGLQGQGAALRARPLPAHLFGAAQPAAATRCPGAMVGGAAFSVSIANPAAAL